MSRDAMVFALSGTFFGLIVGWIIGSQSAAPQPVVAPVPTTAAAPASDTARPLDIQRATELERQAAAQPSDRVARVELANLYYDAERFDLAIPWYEAALGLDPNDVNVSTDLAVCFFYTDQVDRALAQLDQSLTIDPSHPKTLLNQGIIRAFGKQDLEGAAESWEQVIAISPDSEEGLRAQQALDGLRSAHPDDGTVPGGSGSEIPGLP
jgi:tetratricopeptide (TPR) repeat protein